MTNFGKCSSFSEHNIPMEADGLPNLDHCSKVWPENLLTTKEIRTLFRALYDNTNNL